MGGKNLCVTCGHHVDVHTLVNPGCLVIGCNCARFIGFENGKKRLTRTEIITVTKIEEGRVYDGQESFPQNRFENPRIGDVFEVALCATIILSTVRLKSAEKK